MSANDPSELAENLENLGDDDHETVEKATPPPVMNGQAQPGTGKDPAAALKGRQTDLQRIQAEVDAGGREALLRGTKLDELAGYQIRPITFETIILLQQIKSPLIAGIAVEKIENILLDIAKFFVLQMAPYDEATDMAFDDPKKLRQKALEMARSMPANKTQQIIAETMEALKRETENQVSAHPPKGKKTKESIDAKKP